MGALMNRWTALLSALLLVFSLWTGEAAHAAEKFECIPISAEAAGHFDGDSDQKSTDREQGAAHHHSGCNGHSVAATLDVFAVDLFRPAQAIPRLACEARTHGWDPGAGLRPPIA